MTLTATGMPKVGHHVYLKGYDEQWEDAVVVRREGNASNYSLWVTRADGRRWATGNAAGRREKILTEVPWWIRQGTIRLDPPPAPSQQRHGSDDEPAFVQVADRQKVLKSIREGAVTPVQAIVKAMMDLGMTKEEACKGIRWATHTIQHGKPVDSSSNQGGPGDESSGT